MRMWNVPPVEMCQKHLLGEHVELHMFVGHIRLGRALGKFITNNLLDTRMIQSRHDAIAREMVNREMQHKSPMVYTDRLHLGKISAKLSRAELHRRCPDCVKRAKLVQRLQQQIIPPLRQAERATKKTTALVKRSIKKATKKAATRRGR